MNLLMVELKLVLHVSQHKKFPYCCAEMSLLYILISEKRTASAIFYWLINLSLRQILHEGF